jgi:predicted phage terminase large subunit-like protein
MYFTALKLATAEEREQLLDAAPEEVKALVYQEALISLAQTADSPDSFAAFYHLVHGKRMPKHALEEWVRPLYEAREGKKGVVIQAFRGSTKTTTLTVTFAAYRIGKEPQRANLLVQVGDDTAADNTALVADIIANSPAWKRVFPHVVPDFDRGWGAGGYEVKIGTIPYETWRQANSGRKDPTLLGVGYKSREIIGRHPDGLLVVDDIHDENNTSSERELATVRKILTGTIFPTMTPTTWAVFVGTPWVENDALSYCAATGEFVSIKTPVLRGDAYTWAEKFGPPEVEVQKKLNGRLEFARMFLLDLTAARNRYFKYQPYPSSEIRYTWPMVGGVDYASSGDAYKNVEGKGDYFAMAYVAKLPGGGAVVVDGVVDHCTQAQAESYVVRAQEIYPGWLQSSVEAVGKGDDFVQVIRRNPTLRVIPQQAGRRKKEIRLEKEMSPWLENGIVRVSDADTPFLNELRRELDNYPEHTHDDALDALYYALRAMPDVLSLPRAQEELPMPHWKREKQRNPILAFGRK